MTDKAAPAAFEATFCGFRSIGGRKQLVLTFEVPIEHSERVLKTLGSPDAMNPTWVAIALLDKKLMEGKGAQAPGPTQEKERRAFHELPLPQQAALACTNKAFQRFMREECGYLGCNDEHACADAVRIFCDVGSRADLKPDNPGGKSWIGLNARFNAWMRTAL